MKNNIKKIRKSKNMSCEQLAKAIGKAQPTVSKWENAETISYETANLIADYFGCSVDYVLGKVQEDDNEGKIDIPVLDTVACCGNGIVNFENAVIGKQTLTVRAFNEITRANPRNIRIMKVSGESMTPTLNPDDIIWVDISCKVADSDGLYVLCVGEQLVVKRLQISPITNSIEIISDNPRYKPFTANYYQDVRVQGKIIYHCKKVG